uniref:Uncharacterized protein n=1 Tax=Panagrellus redivivus TaxID=6233 RepID=A0A7E4UW45_PANRE
MMTTVNESNMTNSLLASTSLVPKLSSTSVVISERIALATFDKLCFYIFFFIKTASTWVTVAKYIRKSYEEHLFGCLKHAYKIAVVFTLCAPISTPTTNE